MDGRTDGAWWEKSEDESLWLYEMVDDGVLASADVTTVFV